MKSFFTFTIFILISTSVHSQDFNKVIMDEKSGKPILIGECTLEAFQDSSFSWWWNSGYEMFEPDLIPLENIRGELKDIFFLAFMGTWCSDSRQLLPQFFKTLDVIGYASARVKIISLNREKKANIEGEEEFGINFVPTIIIYKDKAEIGRIVEFPNKSLEEDLADIITSHLLE